MKSQRKGPEPTGPLRILKVAGTFQLAAPVAQVGPIQRPVTWTPIVPLPTVRSMFPVKPSWDAASNLMVAVEVSGAAQVSWISRYRVVWDFTLRVQLGFKSPSRSLLARAAGVRQLRVV